MRSVFQAQAVEFPSAYGLAESVARLKAAMRRSVLSDMAHQTAVGRVSARRVRLQRRIPMVGNALKPFFIGRFVERAGSVVLVGRFRMLWTVRVIFAVWFGLLTVATISFTLTRQPHHWAAVGACLAMYAAGAGMLWLGKWLSRNDAAYLSRVIRDALAPDTATVPALHVSRGWPVHQWIAIGCAALAAVYLIAAVLGAKPEGPGSGSLGDLYRVVLVLDGVMLAVMGMAAWRKRLLAWHLGFVFLALGWLQMAFQAHVDEGLPMPTLAIAVALVGSTIVLGIIGWWWYAQRVHFDSD